MPLSRRLVYVIESGKQHETNQLIRFRDPRALVLVDVNAHYLRIVLSKSNRVFKPDPKKGLVPADPKLDDTQSFLEIVSKAQTKQRLLHATSTTPVLLHDLTIVSEPGYHKPSGVFINTRGIAFKDPALSNPCLSADQCRVLLEENVHPVFERFPFEKEHSHQEWHQTPSFAVVLSAIFSVALRNLLPTVYAHCFDAPLQGSGKTKLAQSVSRLATGMLPTLTTYDGSTEFGKLLPVLLKKGDRVILVDNVSQPINNDRLATQLTQEGSMLCRVLGKTEDIEIENNSVFFFTGNNLQLFGDMPRRCLRARLVPDCERPEQRQFDFDPVKRALQMHPDALMTVLAVQRAYEMSGFAEARTKAGDSFEEWEHRVRSLLLDLGYSDPLKTQQGIREADPYLAAHEELIAMVHKAIRDRECWVKEIKELLGSAELPRFLELTNHKPGEAYSELKVGQCFGRLRDRWFGLYRLVWGKRVDGKLKWRVEKRQDEGRHGTEEEPL